MRNGVEIAELRPLARRRRLSAEALVERHRKLPRVDYVSLRQEAGAFSVRSVWALTQRFARSASASRELVP